MDLDELKRKLNVSMFYEFYFESFVIEIKIINCLIKDLLSYYNLDVDLKKNIEFIEQLKYLREKEEKVKTYISDEMIIDIVMWNNNLTKHIIFDDLINDDFGKMVINGKNIISNLQNSIKLIKK